MILLPTCYHFAFILLLSDVKKKYACRRRKSVSRILGFTHGTGTHRMGEKKSRFSVPVQFRSSSAKVPVKFRKSSGFFCHRQLVISPNLLDDVWFCVCEPFAITARIFYFQFLFWNLIFLVNSMCLSEIT